MERVAIIQMMNEAHTTLSRATMTLVTLTETHRIVEKRQRERNEDRREGGKHSRRGR